MNAEKKRLEQDGRGTVLWKQWGPYLAGREWGTVREDYSPDGDAWEYFRHDAARSRAYRWGEDGIGGISDDRQLVCFSTPLWNGRDPFLKERLFGLTGKEGNHGEDVKECYYYLDSTPTHSYMKMLYKYPQSEFPYAHLLKENRRRSRTDPEFEILDTGIFDGGRYFDVFIEYAKVSPSDILIRITAANRGDTAAEIHLLPQVCFRNTWSWTDDAYRPSLSARVNGTVALEHRDLGKMWLCAEGEPESLVCDNDTNVRRLYGAGSDGKPGYWKDGINDCIVQGKESAVNPLRTGTKAACHYRLQVGAGGEAVVRLRLASSEPAYPFAGFDKLFAQRIREAEEFYRELQGGIADADARNIQRQAFAGMLWSKQYYHYNVSQWLKGDPAQPPPPRERLTGRNHEWVHLNNADIVSMPDKWEYPWYALWDLAFHTIPLAMVDPGFAKAQILLMTREWYMHPNGQLPAYEWSLGDVNPPVHAWAAWRVYKIDRRTTGKPDTDFLERVFHKLLLNFTWWVNRKDTGGRNIFQGGFLGFDNIGVFDRSATLPTGGHIEQADGTSWMAMYSLNMMRIALELSLTRPLYQDMATKFFEHFLYIAGAMADIGGEGINMWDQEDGFFYDVLHTPHGANIPLKVRSMVGLIPLCAVEVLEPDLLDKLPEFKRHVEWFLDHRPDLAGLVSRWKEPGSGERRLLSLLRGHRMKRILSRMLDESEFLSDHGIRALSRYHMEHPYDYHLNGQTFTVSYLPAESDSPLFGGNSNWRGPVWFPCNYLIIEALQRFHHYYGDDFKVECPTGSGVFMTINEVADELSGRLTRLFLRDGSGRRPAHGSSPLLQNDPGFRDRILFYEYFHGETGKGLGASHQTGWTGLVAKLLQPRRRHARPTRAQSADNAPHSSAHTSGRTS
jgi:hypothetical protein